MLRKKISLVLIVFFVVIFAIRNAQAELKESDIPEVLRSWVSWVMFDSKEEKCPFFSGEVEKNRCQWPGQLKLNINPLSGDFTQTWEVFEEGYISLPGDEKHWPQDVVNVDTPLQVHNNEGLPHIFLKPGLYTIKGNFFWDSPPESLKVPLETGLVSLILEGKTVSFPERADNGEVRITSGPRSASSKDELEIRVHRKITDDIPLLLTTRINLNISGKNREIVLGAPLPQGFVPMSLTGGLPARLENDGHLRVQGRTGNFEIELAARNQVQVNSISLAETKEPLAPEEVWVFEAITHLRQAEVSGLPTIDPRQTTLPEEWKRLPTYRATPGDALTLTEKIRGDESTPPDNLSLNRTLWLDFSGKGYTLKDEIQGTIHRTWRLDMNAPIVLGRVSIDGEDQLITKVAEDPAKGGVEIRQGEINLDSDSYLPQKKSSLPAVGWDADFNHVVATLNLPPGWRLLWTTGVDEVKGTWMNRWTLLDLFLVFIISLATAKLWGNRWGFFCLITLTLTFTEPYAPRWIWTFVLVFEALNRFLPVGRLKSLMKLCRYGGWFVLILMALPFMHQQTRNGLYPILENRGYPLAGTAEGLMMMQNKTGAIPPPPSPMESEDGATINGEAEDMMEIRKGEGMSNIPSLSQKMNIYQHDPKAMVQTGPGLPQWEWNAFLLQWNGPVEKKQTIRLCLIPPWLSGFLSLSRMVLTGLLVLFFLGFPPSRWIPFFKKIPVGMKGFLVLIVLLSGLPRSAHADIPTNEMLEELKTRLLEKPECHPDCATIPRMHVELKSSLLQIRLEVLADFQTAIPLPANKSDWLPEEVYLNAEPAHGVVQANDGSLWLLVPEGVHQVILQGALSKQESINIPLPLKPFRVVTGNIEGWSMDGIQENGFPTNNLSLTRKILSSDFSLSSSSSDAARELSPALPPFVRIERYLSLGLTWEVETRVVRLTPPGTAVVLEVPLVAGESVITSNVNVLKNRVNVNMAPQSAEFSWRSVLKTTDQIELKAPETFSWAEQWQLDASPIWHVSKEGIPSIHQADSLGPKIPQWRPWPGESVLLKISRPEAVEGQTITIDQSSMTITPGLRATEALLKFKLRSSLGGPHFLTLPKGATPKSLLINNLNEPIRQEGEKVALSLTPGEQWIELQWLDSQGLDAKFKTAPVNIGMNSVNAETIIHFPRNRWILFMGGSPLGSATLGSVTLGPVVLFWPFFILLIFLSITLGKISLSPLKPREWILLGIGLTQTSALLTTFVVGWLLIIGWRKKNGNLTSNFLFNARQIAIVFLTFVSLLILLASIRQGLLGYPDMQITGYGSTTTYLHWFKDKTGALLPQPWIFSLPLFVYRLAMLAWALWIAYSLLRWFKLGWKSFGDGGFWRPLFVAKKSA